MVTIMEVFLIILLFLLLFILKLSGDQKRKQDRVNKILEIATQEVIDMQQTIDKLKRKLKEKNG